MQELGSARVVRLGDAIGLHRLLRKKLGLSRPAADRAVRALKLAANPTQRRLRVRAARAIAASYPPAERIPPDRGYLLFAPGHFPDAATALDRARGLFRALEARGDVERAGESANKRFLISILKDEQFLGHPELLRFMVSRPVLDLASVYLGAVPVLSGASLWWTPPNQTAQASQLYHRDWEDARQLKFFFNVKEVAPEAGPLTFLPADVSDQVRRTLRYGSGRLTDGAVEAAGGAGRAMRLTGPQDAGAVLDTSRCLHYGSRGNTVGRVVLMFQFTAFSAPMARALDWGAGAGLGALDEVQRLALGGT